MVTRQITTRTRATILFGLIAVVFLLGSCIALNEIRQRTKCSKSMTLYIARSRRHPQETYGSRVCRWTLHDKLQIGGTSLGVIVGIVQLIYCAIYMLRFRNGHSCIFWIGLETLLTIMAMVAFSLGIYTKMHKVEGGAPFFVIMSVTTWTVGVIGVITVILRGQKKLWIEKYEAEAETVDN